MEDQAGTDRFEQAVSYAWHDLRGGLNALLLLIEVASRELAARDEFAELSHDLKSARRFMHLVVEQIDRLRALDTYRQGKVVMDSSPVPLKGLMNEVLGHFSRASKEKGVEVVNTCPDVAVGSGNRELLSLMLRSLVAASLEQGPGRITFKVTPADERYWRVEVADNLPVDAARLAAMVAGQVDLQPREGRGRALSVFVAWQAAQLMGLTLGGETDTGGTRLFVDVPVPAGA